MKFKASTSGLAWLTLGGLILLLVLLPSPKKIDVEQTTEKVSRPVVEKVNINSSGKNPTYTLDIQYPKLNGLADTAIEDKVNADIKKEVDGAIATFKNDLSAPPAELKDTASSLTMRTETSYSNQYILSVLLDISAYQAGAAHPSNYPITLNYDLRSGKRVALANLFTPQSKYLDLISKQAISVLPAQLDVPADNQEFADWIKTGAAPKSENYQHFMVGKDGLIIIFESYQVAPGAAGMPRVTIPYALLEKIMDPAGILPLR